MYDDEQQYEISITQEDFSVDSPSRFTDLSRSYAIEDDSDFMKFPADLHESEKKAQRHLLQDKKAHGGKNLLPMWISDDHLKSFSLTYYYYF